MTQTVLLAMHVGPTWLAKTWDLVGESLPEPIRIPAGPMTVTYQPDPDRAIIAMRLPKAVRAPEAHLVGFVARWADQRRMEVTAARYFTLEYSISPVDGTRYDVLCEWTTTGHLNWGINVAVDELAFIEAMRGIDDAGDAAEYNAFMQVPTDDFRNLASLADEHRHDSGAEP